MKTWILGFLLFLSISALHSQPVASPGSPLNIGASYRLHPGNVTQTEVFIVKSPIDQNILFSSCNTLNFVPFFISEGIFVTDNAGLNWRGNDTCTGNPVAFHGGDVGIAIDKNGTFILTRLGRAPFTGLYSHYSNDMGESWSAQQVISTDDLERASLNTDTDPASPFFGRTYAVWVKFAPPFPLMFAYTDDISGAWSDPVPVNNPPARSAGGDITVGPDGTIYTCWAGVTEQSPFREIHTGFASSLNGGETWTVSENAFAMNGISGVLANKSNIRVNSLPGIAVDTTNGPRHGWIYIVTCQKDLSPAGTDPDIILNRSTDGGLTWSPAIRVNQDPVNNGKTQYFPSIHIDKYGSVDILFYDDRTTTSDSAGVFLARSADGGDTWREYEICDHHFKPVPIGGLGQGYQGDNIDLTSTSTKIWPVWMDNSTGIYQIWTVPVDFADVSGTEDHNAAEKGLRLDCIMPNPFYGDAEIRYSLRNDYLHVSMKVYDLFGLEVATLVDDKQRSGSHSVSFKSTGRPAGCYLLKIRAGEEVMTARMIKLN
jgi:hypothetical protein